VVYHHTVAALRRKKQLPNIRDLERELEMSSKSKRERKINFKNEKMWKTTRNKKE